MYSGHMFESAAIGTEGGELPPDPCAGSWWRLPAQAPPVDDWAAAGDWAAVDDWAADDRCPRGVDELLAAHLAGLLTAEPGGVLAAAVQDATSDGNVADLSDDAVISAVVAAQRLLGWAMGAQLIAVAELCRRWEASPLGERSAVAELALASGLSEYAAWQRRDAAVVLPNRLPAIWAALVAGRLEWAKAYEIMDRTSVLTDAAAASIEAAALAVATSSNLPELRAYLSRAVLEADPEAAAERARAAHARRSVTFRPGPDSTGTMALTASAAAVASAEASLNLLTSAAMVDDAEPDPARDRQVTRADVLLDLIESAAAAHARRPRRPRQPRRSRQPCRSRQPRRRWRPGRQRDLRWLQACSGGLGGADARRPHHAAVDATRPGRGAGRLRSLRSDPRGDGPGGGRHGCRCGQPWGMALRGHR